jgi:spore maturation protein CgeB
MIQKVCLLVDYNMYDVLRHFTTQLAAAMNRKGIQTIIIDPERKPLEAYMFREVFDDPPDFTCSFNTFERITEGKLLWDVLKIPHLAFLVDPAIYFLDLGKSPYTIFTCSDRSDFEATHSQFPHTLFWPHAIEKEIKLPKKNHRPYDVVFFGSCFDFESLRKHWIENLPPTLCEVLDFAIDIAMTNDTTTLAEALTAAWGASRQAAEYGKAYFLVLFHYLDKYTRGKDRFELLRSIKDVEVHVYGDVTPYNIPQVSSWASYLSKQSNLILHPSVNYKESFKILKQSKICLNSMPFFRHGTHERVFTGLACGALPITSESSYLRESFKDEEHILYYRTKHWDHVNEQIQMCLKEEEKRCTIVANGRKLVMRDHTWDVRIDQLLHALPPILKNFN